TEQSANKAAAKEIEKSARKQERKEKREAEHRYKLAKARARQTKHVVNEQNPAALLFSMVPVVGQAAGRATKARDAHATAKAELDVAADAVPGGRFRKLF